MTGQENDDLLIQVIAGASLTVITVLHIQFYHDLTFELIFLTHLVEWLCIMRYIGIGVHVPLIKIKLHFRYFSFPFKIAGRRKVR